jgi:hypothetical protein
MLVEKVAPTAVAECGGFFRRTDDQAAGLLFPVLLA